MHIREGH